MFGIHANKWENLLLENYISRIHLKGNEAAVLHYISATKKRVHNKIKSYVVPDFNYFARNGHVILGIKLARTPIAPYYECKGKIYEVTTQDAMHEFAHTTSSRRHEIIAWCCYDRNSDETESER